MLIQIRDIHSLIFEGHLSHYHNYLVSPFPGVVGLDCGFIGVDLGNGIGKLDNKLSYQLDQIY